jgi:hypothetical protein
MHVLSHLKFFDAKLQDWEEANYYFEREWRISQDVKFRLNDLWRVILPPGMKPLEWKRDMIDRAVKRPTSLSKPRSDVHLDENSGCRGSESDISQKHRIPSASVTLAIPANFILRTTLHWQVCVASPDTTAHGLHSIEIKGCCNLRKTAATHLTSMRRPCPSSIFFTPPYAQAWGRRPKATGRSG